MGLGDRRGPRAHGPRSHGRGRADAVRRAGAVMEPRWDAASMARGDRRGAPSHGPRTRSGGRAGVARRPGTVMERAVIESMDRGMDTARVGSRDRRRAPARAQRFGAWRARAARRAGAVMERRDADGM